MDDFWAYMMTVTIFLQKKYCFFSIVFMSIANPPRSTALSPPHGKTRFHKRSMMARGTSQFVGNVQLTMMNVLDRIPSLQNAKNVFSLCIYIVMFNLEIWKAS